MLPLILAAALRGCAAAQGSPAQHVSVQSALPASGVHRHIVLRKGPTMQGAAKVDILAGASWRGPPAAPPRPAVPIATAVQRATAPPLPFRYLGEVETHTDRALF